MISICSRPGKFIHSMLLFLMLISLFGCFRKKNTSPSNLQEWLEAQWPGKYEVISALTNFTDKEYYFGKRKSVVAEKADRDVQFILSWKKDEENFGLTKEMIEEAVKQSQDNVVRARNMIKLLNTAGLQNVSVGVSQGFLDIFLFAEPTQDERERAAKLVLNTVQSLPQEDRLPCDISFMEEKMYGTEFNDVIPAGHWARIDSWQHRNQIMKLSIPIDVSVDLQTLSKQWQFNTLSDRMLEYVAQAHPVAVKWAAEKMRQPVRVEEAQMVAFGLDEKNGLIVEIDFPYFADSGDTTSAALGKISGKYDIDAGTFTRIKSVRNTEDDQ